jgi:hypothetical protein
MARWCAPLLLCCLACGGKHGSTGGGGGSGHAGTGASGSSGSGPSLPTDGGPMDATVCTIDLSATPADCPSDLPSACDAPAPSYKDAVSQTIAEVCQPCHRAGGLAADKPFDSYARVYARRRTILDLVNRCLMPPASAACDAAQPSPAQRQELLQWLVCGAPQN